MKNKVKLLLIALMFVGLSMMQKLQAQTPAEWTTIDTVGGVVISYQVSSCQGVEKVYLKMVNTGSASVTVNWNLWSSTGTMQSLVIPAAAVKIGECSINSEPTLEELIPEGKTISNMLNNFTVTTN
jgi:hypothetical protein